MRVALLSLISLPVLTLGCGMLTAPITEPLPEITVPAAVTGEESIGQLQSIDIPAQSTGPADFGALDSLTFSGTGTTGNFDFLAEVHVIVSSPGLADVEVANLVPVPTGVTSLALNIVPNLNLMPYLQAGCSIQVNAVGAYPTVPFSFDGQLVASIGL